MIQRHAWGAAARILLIDFCRNWATSSLRATGVQRMAAGELDLVAWDGPSLVIVEVKSRASADFGLPEEAVDADKRVPSDSNGSSLCPGERSAFDCLRFDIVSVLITRRSQSLRTSGTPLAAQL